MEPLLSLTTIARQLDVSERRVLRWLRAGQFPAPVELPDGGRQWRAASVAAWVAELPTAQRRIATAPTEQRTAAPVVDLDSLPQVARDIFRVLTEANGLWMSGEEICRELDQPTDHRSGHFWKMTKLLRKHGLIESNRTEGYRVAAAFLPPSEKAAGGKEA